jgi:two-component system, NarL family, sensor histidine kinase DesK
MPDAVHFWINRERHYERHIMTDKPHRSMEGLNIGTQSNTGYIWLAYSIFFIIDPILSHSRRLWIESGIIYAIFLVIYVSYMRAGTTRQRHLLLVALYVLGMVSIPINSGGSSFFIYSAAFLPFVVVSVPIIVSVLTVQAIGLLIEGLILHVNPISLGLTISIMAIVGASNSFIARQKRADTKLRMAHEEIEQLAAVAERERIARDLHDVLGHTLSVIVLKSELAGRLIERDPQRAAQEIADVERTARTALSEVREAIGGYRSQGLPAEMELARRTLQAAGVSLACESPMPQLRAEEETVLCLAVREAVTNIVRHARATHCRMRFTASNDGYHSLLIMDNGAHATLQEGNGLRGMRERIQSLGGRLSITTNPGVTLLIELPQTNSGYLKAPCVAL